MGKREVNVAEQQDVCGHPQMAGFEGVHPSLALHSPRREKLLQTSRLDVQRHVVRPPDMVHAVLWRALPHGAPGHRTPPQLAQIQMICSHMSLHITLNPLPTVGTIPRPGITESFLGRRMHRIQVLLEPHHTPSTVTGHCHRRRERLSRETDGSDKSPILTMVTS